MTKFLSIALSLILGYVTLEFWAQTRFYVSNVDFPSTMRNNMGINLYDAFKLKANYRGTAPNGIEYATDTLGFSINPKVERKAGQGLLIGGDSRAFSLFLPWQASMAGQLERAGEKVFLQAFPGSSPAMFNHDMFTLGGLVKFNKEVKRVYYVYDRNDAFGDRQFSNECRNPLAWYSLRNLKLKLGGYFWNMLSIKFRSFMKKAEIKTSAEVEVAETSAPVVHESLPTGFEIHTPSLEVMKRECDELNLPLVLIYLPRYWEIVSEDPSVSNDLKRVCAQLSIPLINLYPTYVQLCARQVEAIRPYFIDLDEGIHLSEKGLNVVSKAILEYESSLP